MHLMTMWHKIYLYRLYSILYINIMLYTECKFIVFVHGCSLIIMQLKNQSVLVHNE